MKKVLSLILALIMIISMSTPSYASENNSGERPCVEYISPTDISTASFSAYENGVVPFTTHYFSLDNTPYNNIISDFVEYEIQEGEDVTLTIVSCSWYPHTCDIRVGLFNLDTSYAWYYTFSGGEASGSYNFPDMPEGTYMVYVRNVSSETITDGSVRYSIT